jgi:hypothetical protein
MSMKQDSVDDSTTLSTCRQTVEAYLATPHHRLAADRHHSESKGIRQSVKLYDLNRSNETIPWICGCTIDKSLRARRASP